MGNNYQFTESGVRYVALVANTSTILGERTSAEVFALLCVFFRVEERAQCVCITRKRGAVCQNRLVLRVYSRVRVCDAGGEYNYDLRRMHS